jgi:hypothetical protein
VLIANILKTKEMRLLRIVKIAVLLMTSFNICLNAQIFSVNEKIVNNALMDYLKKKNITNNEDKVFQTSQVEIGDLNYDRKPDAVVRYVLGLKMGNAITGSGIVVFLNTGNSLSFATDYQDKPDAILKSITNGIIFLEVLIYGPDDPRCCPSIKSKTGLMLVNNKLTEIN